MRGGAAAAEAARDWILRSGIQIQAPGRPMRGAFNAWYDLDAGAYQYVYPEITGYGITTLLYIRSVWGGEGLLERACAAGDWVLRRAIDASGGIRPRDYYQRQERSALFSFERHLVVTFDSGMVLFGLTNLYEATGRPRYLAAARRIGRFLAERARRRGGLLYACYDPARRLWIDRGDKWSAQSGSYHAKVALGLLHLARLTGEGSCRRAAEGLCRASLRLQLPSGRYVTYRDEGATHLHPHLYSAEGLLAAGLSLGRRDFLRSAARAVEWALSVQLPDGGLPCLAGPRGALNPHERSDTLAQCLRLGRLCGELGLLARRAGPRLERLERRLLAFQRKAAPGSGGFLYGREMSGEVRNHLNFWCTAFALQALGPRPRGAGSPGASLFI